jgi:hypothetical protein
MKEVPVLIIDDSEDDRYLLSRQLKKTNLNIIILEAKDGEEGLELFRAHQENREKFPNKFPPIIIFLDINMPRADGHQFLKEFSELKSRESIETDVIMMFTSSDQGEDKEKALSYDFVRDYLLKGKFSLGDLKKKVESFT